MKNIPAKFYLSLGLTSLLVSILLLAMFLQLLPDPLQERMKSRIVFSESIASSSSLFLQKGDYPGIKSNLQFALDRNIDLLAATVTRINDNSTITLGEIPASVNSAFAESVQTENELYIPILRNNQEWGVVRLFYTPLKGRTFVEKFRNSRLALVGVILLAAFVSFYFYLGKMLKQLNPSAAVPGRVRSALDTIAESLLVINRKGELVLANEAFGVLMGQKADSLLGLNADELPWVHEVGEEDSILPWTKVLAGGEPTRHDMIWLNDHTGERRKFIVNCSPVAGTPEKPGGVLISLDDVTLLEQKEIELMRSKEEAEDANKAKSDFLSNMSHEIRTPMTAILGFTEVLKRGYTTDEAASQKYLSTISRSGNHLLQLINDILDLSKVESGALEIEKIACAPGAIVHDVIQVLNVKAEEKGIFLRQEINSSLPETIESDPARLRQIITNLVGNAIKFTEEGGVSIELHLVENDEKQQLAIAVKDTGIGMTPEAQAGIFDAFSQADSSITRRFGGTGLGLSISKDLSVALGGSIAVESAIGEGSTFTVLVDVGDLTSARMLSPDEQRAAANKLESDQHAIWRFEGASVLVVDDAIENRDLLTLILEELAIRVDVAENGRIGVDKALVGNYDLVLMDIQMPVLDGFGAVAELRANNYQAPIVALTANAMKGYDKKLLAAGFSHYMTKPLDIDKLTALLSTIVEGVKLNEEDIQASKTRVSAAEDVKSLSALPEIDDSSQPINEEPIYSTLALSNEKFIPIAASFIEKLKTRLPEMDHCIKTGDMVELALIAHWLKGSGGSVGFSVFTETAKNLEAVAKSGNTEKAIKLILEIGNYTQRLDSSGVKRPTEFRAPRRSAINVAPSSIGERTKADDSSDDACFPIESTLSMDHAGFRAIVRKFIPRLNENLALMQTAKEEGDFLALGTHAHWLKGSGGTVGFNVFTDPARDLELAAKNSNHEMVDEKMKEINGLAARLVVPDDTDDIKKIA